MNAFMIYRKILLAGPILVIGIFLAMMPVSSDASPSDDEKTVAALDKQYQAAVEKNDAETMDRILADDFVLVTGLGKTFTKSDLLKEARSKHVAYEHQEDSSQKVRVWGDTAVVTALLWAKGVKEGKAFDDQLWFSDVYVRTPAGWKYAFGQASTKLPKTP
jgi:ketosteroid isomerase-like protein